MKTINIKSMKKQITIFVMAVLLMPLTAMAQDVFEKYSDNDAVTYVSIKPKMFQMLASMDINTDDPEAKEYLEMVNSITSFKTLVTGDKAISADIIGYVKGKTKTLEELMEVKDNGVVMKFYVKEGKDSDHVKELLMFVNGLDAVTKGSNVNINGKDRKFETVIVSLTGDIDLKQISKLTRKMNLPGGDELEKKNKK